MYVGSYGGFIFWVLLEVTLDYVVVVILCRVSRFRKVYVHSNAPWILVPAVVGLGSFYVHTAHETVLSTVLRYGTARLKFPCEQAQNRTVPTRL